jgi:hypothetical protein
MVEGAAALGLNPERMDAAANDRAENAAPRPRASTDYLPDDPGRVVPWLGPFADVPGVLPTPCWLFTPPPTLVPVVP